MIGVKNKNKIGVGGLVICDPPTIHNALLQLSATIANYHVQWNLKKFYLKKYGFCKTVAFLCVEPGLEIILIMSYLPLVGKIANLLALFAWNPVRIQNNFNGFSLIDVH